MKQIMSMLSHEARKGFLEMSTLHQKEAVADANYEAI